MSVVLWSATHRHRRPPRPSRPRPARTPLTPSDYAARTREPAGRCCPGPGLCSADWTPTTTSAAHHHTGMHAALSASSVCRDPVSSAKTSEYLSTEAVVLEKIQVLAGPGRPGPIFASPLHRQSSLRYGCGV